MSALLSACRSGGPVLHWLLKNLINSCSCALPSSKSLENFLPPALSGWDTEQWRELRERATVKHWKARLGTFQLLEGLVVADVDPHGGQLLLPQVHVLDGSLVLAQLVYERLGLTQKETMRGHQRSQEEGQLFHLASMWNCAAYHKLSNNLRP